jgi:acetylornithine deacetylase
MQSIDTSGAPPVNSRAVVDLTRELIRFDSVTGNERDVAIFIRDYFASNGVAVRIAEVAKDRPNVYAIVGRGDPRLLFNGHVDTVPVGNGWTRNPFGADEQDGRLYGRGASDMKSGLAAMMAAVVAAHRHVTVPNGSLSFAAVIDEEISSLGTRAAIADGVAAPVAIIAEPTELQTICAAKGNCYFTIVVSGRAAHAGSPELGINAISAATRIARAVERHDAELSTRRHLLLGRPYATVTRISGGTGESAIPDRCLMIIDRRLLPDETGASALTDLRRSLERVELQDARFEVTLDMELPAMDLAPAHPFVEQVRRTSIDCGASPRPVGGWSAACDGGHLHRAGVPTVLFGPGSITQQAHRPDESVPLDELMIAARTYSALAIGALQ